MSKAWPAGLLNLLNTDPPQLYWADLYTFALANGDLYRFASYDGDVTVGGNTWRRAGGAANLLRSSQDFEGSPWVPTNNGGSPPTVTADSQTAPDGSGTADTLNFPAVGSGVFASFTQYLPPFAAGTTITYSVWLKAASSVVIYLRADQGAPQDDTAVTVTTSWQRFSITSTQGAAGQPFVATIYSTNAGAKTIYAWGAQLEVATSIGPYVASFISPIPKGPQIRRSSLTQAKGTEVSTMDLSIADDNSCLIGGVPILLAIQQGILDGATVQLDLAASLDGITWQGPGTYFLGANPEVQQIGRTLAKVQVKSKLQDFNIAVPRMLVQPGCRWTLFDKGCTLNRASFAVNGSITSATRFTLTTNLTQQGPAPGPTATPSLSGVSAHNIPAQTYYVKQTYVNALGETTPGPEGSIALSLNQRLQVASPAGATGITGWNCYIALSPGDEQLQNSTPIAIGTAFTVPDYQQFPTSGAAVPQANQSGYFDLGVITFTSGLNTGVTRSVKVYTNPSGTAGIFVLSQGLPFVPSAGDNFTAYPGCDKSLTTCILKFNNKINHGGFEFVPIPETAV